MLIKDLSSANAFVDNSFNRLGEKRKNADWVALQLAAEDSVVVPVWKHRCATHGHTLRFASVRDFPDLEQRRPILLGRYNNSACFAIDVGQDEQPPAAFADWEFHGLRTIGMTFAADEAALAAYAQAGEHRGIPFAPYRDSGLGTGVRRSRRSSPIQAPSPTSRPGTSRGVRALSVSPFTLQRMARSGNGSSHAGSSSKRLTGRLTK